MPDETQEEKPAPEENIPSEKKSLWRTVGVVLLVVLLLCVLVSAAWMMLAGNRESTPTPTMTPCPTFTPYSESTVVSAPLVVSTPTVQVVMTIPPTTTSTPVKPSATPTIHVVKQGETLLGISEHYNLPLELLMRANGIKDPNTIYVGQVLVVPETGQMKIHVVRPGETLSGIAEKYGVDYNRLLQVNHIANPDTIYVGQKLIIP